MKNSREYAISLLPCLVPASGPIIASLIASGVSRYGGFCLLNAVAVCSPRDEQRLEEAWDLAKVPASKEDVFKDRSMGLLDKRKLMKFLMFAASDAENPPELEGLSHQSLISTDLTSLDAQDTRIPPSLNSWSANFHYRRVPHRL